MLEKINQIKCFESSNIVHDFDARCDTLATHNIYGDFVWFGINFLGKLNILEDNKG